MLVPRRVRSRADHPVHTDSPTKAPVSWHCMRCQARGEAGAMAGTSVVMFCWSRILGGHCVCGPRRCGLNDQTRVVFLKLITEKVHDWQSVSRNEPLRITSFDLFLTATGWCTSDTLVDHGLADNLKRCLRLGMRSRVEQ